MAISSINAASATSSNWLKEAQESIAASQSQGGLMGMLNDARNDPGSLKSVLTKSANAAASLASMAASAQTASNNLMLQMQSEAQDKRLEEKMALYAKMNPQITNYTPPKGLDAFIYFDDGSSIDTVNNILTLSDGTTQIDITTGLEVIDPNSIFQLANGAYLDTKKNIMTLADGTKIDTITGLVITA
jgi:hypothetical protein